ncbi:MAG TPA: hypothetical protein VGE21_04770 [Flavobacteriales bacterium]
MRNAALHRLSLLLAGTVMAMVHGDLQAQTAPDSSRIILKPQFALGTGMFAFYGDIGSQNRSYSPLVSRIGFELRASTPVNDWLEVGVNAVHGRLSMNERGPVRNLNFESRITTGGMYFAYNFHHLLNPRRVVEPYVSVGFESVEFLSKTDLFDGLGRRYHYWADGTIRDIAESAPNAIDAVQIERDYTYESDVRETNADGFGKYAERTFAIPVGVGAKMHLGGGFDLRFGATMHFTRTDLLDGVTSESVGNRQGDSKLDRFLYSSVSISYAVDLERKKSKKWKPTISAEEMDAIALNDDEDGDGVPDWSDHCPFTPAGVAVDINGCPIDGDGDGVADINDDEPNSLPGAIVDQRGATITDEALLRAYLNYLDSGNVTTITSRVESFGPKGKPRITRADRTDNERTYVVQVGSQVEGISEEMMQKILSLPDVRTMTRGDTTFYVVGNYDQLPEALRRELALAEQGIDGNVMESRNGRLTRLEGGTPNGSETTEPGTASDPAGKAVIRVQLGAFREKMGDKLFQGIPNIVKLTGEDGLTRYYTGSFSDVNDAARHKVEMLLQGFNGAFLVAFKDGKRVSMQAAGAQVIGVEDLKTLPAASINKEFLSFRVQVATYAGNVNVPMEALDKYVELGNVSPVTSTNSVRYLYGNYPSRAAAEQARIELQNLGFQDAFVVGEMNGHIITADDAEYLLGNP